MIEQKQVRIWAYTRRLTCAVKAYENHADKHDRTDPIVAMKHDLLVEQIVDCAVWFVRELNKERSDEWRM